MAQTLTEVAVEVYPDLRRLKPATILAAKEAGEAGGEELGDGITRGADGKLRDSRGKFIKAGSAVGESFGDGITRGADGKLRDSRGKFLGSGRAAGGFIAKGVESGFGDTFAKVAATMAARFALIGGAAAAAAPGVLQLVGALAPAAGVASALPAALLAIKAATGTAKVAVMGFGEAVQAGFGDDTKAASKALEGLSGNARAAAKQFIAFKKPITDLQSSVSNRFFLPLLNDITPLAQRYVPLLREEMSDLAGRLGGFAESVSKAARQGVVMKAVRDVFDATGLSVVKLRTAVGPLTAALGSLVSSTATELPKLAEGFSGLVTRVSSYITEASKSGQVTKAFENGKQVLSDLGAIISNVGVILLSVYRAANQGGNGLLGNLRQLTGQAAEFLQKASGFGALTAVFNTLNSVGGALRAGLGAVLPALAESLQVIGPALSGLAGPASQLVVAIAPLLPILVGVTAQIITALTPAIASLANFLAGNETAVKAIVVALTAYGVALKVTAAVAAVQAAGGILAWAKATTIATNVTRIATVAQYAFGAAIRFATGPIGLIITAVGLLVAAIVYLWKNNETFRDIVMKVWSAVKSAISATVDWVRNVAWPWMVNAFKAIGDAGRWMWEKVLKPTFNALVGFWRGVLVPTAMWLWKTIFVPVFNGISTVVKIASAVVQLTLAILVAFFRKAVAPVFLWLWKNIVMPVFNGIKLIVTTSISYVTKVLQALIIFFRNNIAPVFTWFWKKVVTPVFNGVKDTISNVWTKGIKPILQAVGGFIKDNVAVAFKTGVDGIAKAWDKLRDAARKPVEFVVNNVVNPLIGGFNKLAGVFGTTPIDTIKGFASGGLAEAGGRIPGNSGGRDDRMGQMIGRGGKLLGAITVASGEFIVNARDTARALPLLKWINAGMKGGPLGARERIGRPITDRPGDGSEGWAFAKGGLVGFLDDIWDAVSNPAKAITDPVNAALKNIPGAGMIRTLLVGMGEKLAGGLVGFLGGNFGADGPAKGVGKVGGGNLGKAMAFIRAQNGKPYVWASAGPGGYDCSGIVSAAWNILHGRSPYSHTFSTGSLPGTYFPKSGPGGLLTAGWAHPGQRGASASVGHMAGQFIGGMSFESSGSRGVHINTGRKPADFAHQGHFAGGGMVGPRSGIAQIARADFGSVTLKRGWNLIENATGKPEPLASPMADGEALAVLRAILGAIEDNPAKFARAMGGTTTGLIREARRR